MTTDTVEQLQLLPGARDGCIAGWFVGAAQRRGRTARVDWHDDGRWVFGAIDVPPSGAGLEEDTRRAYLELFAALDEARAPQLLRLWNAVPRINAVTEGLERYRQFNIGRQRAFVEAGRDAFEGAPAACAVGVADEPLSIRFLAGRAAAWPIENPRQVSAYRYSAAYGPRSPTFSRAALADAGEGRVALFVSGTASIVGEASMHEGDVRAQLDETLRNLDTVLGVASGRCSVRFAAADLHWVAYLRDPSYWEAVRAPLSEWAGAAPLLPIQADICRRELLIEIEGHAFASGTRVR